MKDITNQYRNVSNSSPFENYHNATVGGVELTKEQNDDPTYVGSDAFMLAEFEIAPDGSTVDPKPPAGFWDKLTSLLDKTDSAVTTTSGIWTKIQGMFGKGTSGSGIVSLTPPATPPTNPNRPYYIAGGVVVATIILIVVLKNRNKG